MLAPFIAAAAIIAVAVAVEFHGYVALRVREELAGHPEHLAVLAEHHRGVRHIATPRWKVNAEGVGVHAKHQAVEDHILVTVRIEYDAAQLRARVTQLVTRRMAFGRLFYWYVERIVRRATR